MWASTITMLLGGGESWTVRIEDICSFAVGFIDRAFNWDPRTGVLFKELLYDIKDLLYDLLEPCHHSLLFFSLGDIGDRVTKHGGYWTCIMKYRPTMQLSLKQLCTLSIQGKATGCYISFLLVEFSPFLDSPTPLFSCWKQDIPNNYKITSKEEYMSHTM